MIIVASWNVSRVRLERVIFPTRVGRRRRRTFELFTESSVSQQPVVESRREKMRMKSGQERDRGRREEREGVCVIPIVRDHSGEHVGIEREQVNTFREEIARRTDTSRARSSYPQHPAVAAAATVAAAVEGDEAEHARNSAPFTPCSPPLSPSDGLQATHPPIRFLFSSSLSSAILLSSVNLCVVAASIPRSSCRIRPRNLTLPFTCLLV